MNPDNNHIREYLNVDKYHKMGYTGKNIILASAEDIVLFREDVNDINQHDYFTTQALLEIAPDTTLKSINFYLTNSQINKTINDIIESDAIGIFRSMSSKTTNTDIESKYDEEFDKIPYFAMFNSIGNDNYNGFAKYTAENDIMGVGSYYLRGDKVAPAFFSSLSPYVDIITPTSLWIDDRFFSGTSCSAPVMAGMYVLFQDFFKSTTGQFLTRDMAYKFILDHTTDYHTNDNNEGFDTKTGYGVFILPDPDTINVEDYIMNDILEKFTDSDEIPYGRESMEKMVKNGIINGTSETTLSPNMTVSRIQLAVMLDRYNKKVEEITGLTILD